MGNIDIFEAMATKYDSLERIEMSKIIANEIRNHIVSGKEKIAIDYGCGTGLVGLELYNEFHSLLFVDAAKNMITLVQQKIKNNQIKNATALCLDLESSMVPNFSGDYLLLVQVLLHVQDIEPFLRNLYEHLNNNGQILIVDFNYTESIISDKVHNGFKQENLMEIMEEIGFAEIKVKTFYHGKNNFMNQDASLFLLDAKKIVKN
ncbi:class I SAM-dependent methyltransferase [Enterococcus rivorum]|uniref:Methyltransferase type 12 n=1 Tax=Enterococcus rivorum TaxID=762845 RepID=A0A1E5KZG4_9ENTE|nr:class I SAM-dependent methyltransferase [Enterococcus rivorum]MBP2099386.1 ubiquinone/menaquinone biosynthesis C-methylase UbiE [Enterococcus rivorum]OEH83250.1 methyltransferase type 12 [Enterococcus rivorum]